MSVLGEPGSGIRLGVSHCANFFGWCSVTAIVCSDSVTRESGDDAGSVTPPKDAMRLRQRLLSPTFIATILPSDQPWLTATRERCRGVVFSGVGVR